MNKDFSKIITHLRKEKKISQKQVADDLGISQALLSHYEKGIRECGLDFIVKVADYYEVSTDYLLGRTTQRYSDIYDNKEELSEERKIAISQIANKRLIINTITIIYEYLIKAGSKRLSDLISNYLMLSIYNIFRLIYSSNQKNFANLFTIDKSSYKGYTQATLQIINSKIDASTNYENEAEYIKTCSNLSISPQTISDDYPDLASSIFNIIQKSENVIRKTIR